MSIGQAAHYLYSGTAAIVVVFLVLRLINILLGDKPATDVVRGRSLIDYDDAQTAARKLVQKGEQTIVWAGLELPESMASRGLLIAGQPGSGKTICVDMFLASVFPAIKEDSDYRAVYYDAKNNAGALFAGMKITCPIYDLNPFHAGPTACAWDIAKDLDGSHATAHQIATILIPADPGASQPFFVAAGQHLIYGALVALMTISPDNWTLADLVIVAQSAERMKQLLAKSPSTEHLIPTYFAVEDRINDVMATIATKFVAPYTFIAAAWSRCTTKISIREWLTSSSILVLGHDDSHRHALQTLNQVFFQRLTELALSQPDSTTRRTYVVIDEARHAGKLSIDPLLTNGRSRGIRVCLSFQDVQGMHEVYGQAVTSEIAGQIGNLAILKLSSPATAKWAADLFGPYEEFEDHMSESENTGDHGESQGTTSSKQLARRDAVLYSEFYDLPLASPNTGVSGYFIVPDIGAYKATIPWNWIQQRLPTPDPSGTPISRPSQDEILEPWTDADYRRLKLTQPTPQPSAASPAKPPAKKRRSLKDLSGIS